MWKVFLLLNSGLKELFGLLDHQGVFALWDKYLCVISIFC